MKKFQQSNRYVTSFLPSVKVLTIICMRINRTVWVCMRGAEPCRKQVRGANIYKVRVKVTSWNYVVEWPLSTVLKAARDTDVAGSLSRHSSDGWCEGRRSWSRWMSCTVGTGNVMHGLLSSMLMG